MGRGEVDSTPETPKENKKFVDDLKVGDEVYIPWVGWRRVKRVSKDEKRIEGRKNTVTIWKVEYEDENGVTDTWKWSPNWQDSEGNKFDGNLLIREPGTEGEEPSTSEVVPDQIAGLPAGSRATSKNLEGKANIWLKQEDGSWVNIKTGEIVDELPTPIKQYGGSQWWSDYEFTEPKNMGGEDLADDDDSDLVDEVIIDSVINEDKPKPTVDDIVEEVQKRRKLTRAERKALKKEKNHRQQMLIKIIDSNFGPGSFDLKFRERAAVRAMLYELDDLSTEELEDISRVVNQELGWKFIKNLPDKAPEPDQTIIEPEEKPEDTDTAPDDADIIDAEIIPSEEEVAEEERARKLKEIRDRKKREREDKLIAEDEKAEKEKTKTEKPEEKPADLSSDKKKVLRDLVAERRKLQDAIDEADLADEVKPEEKKALKDALDELTRRIDEIVLSTSDETPTAPEASSPAVEGVKEPEDTSSQAKLLKGVTTDQLKPGDVLVNDHFTITDIKREGTKRVNVGGVSQDIPSYRVSGYFPGSVEQSSKLWSENYATDLYRGATPPAKGDSPELNQPKAEDYGSEYAFPNQTKVRFKERTLYAPKNKELADKFLEDYAVYDAERLRRKALWEVPEISKENNNDSPVTPKNSIYTEKVLASDVKVGDIAFRFDKFGAREFFTVTKVVGTKDGVTSLEGHYVGHQTQIKEWRSGTSIDVIRGETNLPLAGDKEPLDRPDKTAPFYFELEKERKAKIAEADKGYSPDFPTDKAAQGITALATKPTLPAFYGSSEELIALGDGAAILSSLDSSDKGFIVFDFETIGKDVQNSANPDAPIQVAAVKYVGGEKVDELNIYINPGEPLGNYYYETDEAGNKTLKANRMRDAEGNPITDEWLATQPSVKEQLQKLVDFFGPNAVLVGQNNTFDINLLERWAEKLGINFKLDGAIDTLAIAKALQKIEEKSLTFPKSPSDGDEILSSEGNAWVFSKDRNKWVAPSNSLSVLAKRLGVSSGSGEDFHNALFDVEVTEKVLRALLGKLKAGDIPAGGSKKYDEKFKTWVESRDQRARDISEIEAAKLLSGKTSNLDDAIASVDSVSDEKVVIAEGEEEITPVKSYVSGLYKDTINEDWVKDPENTDFIPNAKVKDIKPGDFIFGEAGDILEVIKLEDDEVLPANFVKVVRANMNTGLIFSERQTPREDGGTGWFLNKNLEGGIYRRKENAEKTRPQIETEIVEAIEVSDPVVIPVVEPVKGEEVTPEQAAVVVDNAIDAITTSKPDSSIEEAVKGLNVDETIKDQVVAEPEAAPADTKEASSSVHISADGEPIGYRDRVIHGKNLRTGVITSLMPLYAKKYKNYVKVKFDDNNLKENVAASALRIVEKSTIGEIRKPLVDSDSLAEVTAKIKDNQAANPSESALNPEELAQKFKEAEVIRDKEVEETNFVKTSSATVKKITENLPIKSTTKSSLPSLKTGETFDITFAFDKPNAKELKDRSDELNLDSENDLIVFRATKDLFLRNQPIATIKPDGSIVWKKDNDKRSFSLELKKALENLENPVTNISAMTVMAEPDDNEGTDYENDGNGTLLGELESTFDYNNISKFPPTDEQRVIIDAIMSGKNVVVQALAGTGKTSTLVLTAERLKLEKPDNKILYNVFNKETAEEAQGRMPDNVDSRTSDGLAYAQMKGHQKRNQLSGATDLKGRSLLEYADYINLFEYYEFEPVTVMIRGAEVTLGRNELVPTLREAVSKFAISADDTLTEKHFAKKEAYYDAVPQVLVDYANRIWDDAREVDGWKPNSPKLAKISFDTIFKAWAINNPQFSNGLMPGATSSEAEYKAQKLRFNQMFMFDEAQDINPVTAKLLKDQENIQKVYVGDSNQAIYAFRGAVDELNNITGAVELYLTRTFRFGPTIAAIPNRFLTLLGSKKKIIGKPGEDDGVVFEAPGTMEDPTMIIGRTNGALLAEVFEMLAAGKKPGLNLETYFKLVSYAKSAKWLMEANTAVPSGTKPKLHPDLAGFQNWNEVLKAVQEGRNVGGATYFVRLLRDRGMFPSQILQTLGQITPIRGTGFREDEYVPLEKEVLKEGSKGDLGNGRSAQGFKIKTKYEVKDGILELRNVQNFQDFFLKRDDIKDLITWKQITEFNPKAKKDVTYSVPTLAITPETEEKVLDLVNDIRRWLNNYSPRIPIDAELITAHKSKGKESDRVKLLNDFAQPELDDEGVMQLPDPEELRLSYVATSRAKKALDIGESLAWILEFTKDEDGFPELTEVENIIGMSVAADPEPVTPEEAGKEVVKARKITDQKTLEVAERLIGLIEKGVVPWTKGWTAGGVPMNGVSKKAYKGTNTMVLWAAIAENGWKDPRFFTFNQGKELGGSVRKGEKGTTILKPNIVSKEVKQKDGSLKKQTYMYFTNVSVFNAEQFDNLKLPALIKREPVPITDIETQILKSYVDHPEIINQVQDSAYYLPSEDKIYLPLREQFKDVQGFIETLFHELAHSTGHISRLGKDGKRKDLQDNYGKHREARGEEELIAEISVALIAAEFGVEIDWGNVAAYADSWLTPLKNDPGMIIIAAKQAQDAVNRILGVDSTKTDDEIKSAFPGLQDYKDGGSGGLVGSRSTVGFVSTDALKDMTGNVAGNEEAIESYRKSLREGKGFAIKDFNGRPFNDPIMVIYDNETGLAYVGEGNHRLQAAIAENIPYVPVRVVNGRASEMAEDAEKGRFPKQIKNDKEPEFLETGSLSGQPVSEGYVPPEMHPSYVFDKEFISDIVPDFVGQSDPFAPPAVGEGVGSEGLTGDQIAEDGGLKPEPTPEPNVGEQGKTGEEIAAETGVASIKGEYQKGTSNSGALKDGMNYEIQMRERNLISGQTSGDLYGVRKIVVSGNTFKNKEELKSAGFTYDGDTKTWSKSYFEMVFPADILTQDVLDRNPDPEIDKDLSKFLDKPAAQSTAVGEPPAASSKTPKNKDNSVEPTKFTFQGKEYDLWDDITYDRESDSGADNQSLEGAHGIFARRILDDQDLITDRDEISDYISEILNKYGYGNKFFLVASGDVSNKMLGKDPIKGSGEGIEAGIGRADNSIIPDGNPLKEIEFPVFLIRKRGASKVALLHEIAHLMEAGWKTGLGGGHNQIWHQTFLALLRQEGFQKEANLLSLTIGEVKGDTGAISP
jgi:antirestriction protein ArdC/DNA polymerase III epsilon subunit-like protein